MYQRQKLKQSFWLCIIANEKEEERGPGLQSAECNKYGTGKGQLEQDRNNLYTECK